MSLSLALAPLARYPQFIVVRLDPLPTGKTDKVPVDWRTGANHNAHDPAIWQTYDAARTVATSWGPRFTVGFDITSNDPFWCLDIDSCLTPAGWSDTARGLCALLPGTAVEVSQSGRGLHIWGTGPVPPHAAKNTDLNIELYDSLRFIALGDCANAVGDMSAPCAAIAPVANTWFPFVERIEHHAAEGPCPEWRGPTEDADLLRRAMKSEGLRAAFGTGATFADLWHADAEALARAYPPKEAGTEPYDASSADMALASMLAFWTGRDIARIERLMRQSHLARAKWDDRHDYLVSRTIGGAVAMCRNVLQDKPPEPSPLAEVIAPTSLTSNEAPVQKPITGSTFLGPTEQIELFKGCVYVVDLHQILVPGGELVNEGRFKATYGGYTYAMDSRNERTSRNAWEAFTESQVLRCPRAQGTCFMPQHPPGAILSDGGRTRVNTWWPIEVPCVEGDVTPFLQHLAKLLPDARDQTILLAYMAACVQHRGVKFQWAPLVQGVEGNGKTLLSRCVSEALGKRYVHWPKASKIAKQFNGWLFGKLFYAVEDIHTPEGNDVIEELKPMITGGDGIEIEKKGIDQISAEICGNFMFNSNHKNGLRKTRNDRRFAMFYTAQQEVDDLARDGLNGDYMQRIYDWLKLGGGYAAVTHFLKHWPIPDEFNPAGQCQRAPVTSSTEAAIANGLGRVEQEILEAVDQGTPGFCGGWISSMAVDRLLDRMGRAGAVPLARRRDMLRDLGYDWHPALQAGRVHNTVAPDGGKPRLFVRRGHPSLVLEDAAAVARAYAAAQGIGS